MAIFKRESRGYAVGNTVHQGDRTGTRRDGTVEAIDNEGMFVTWEDKQFHPRYVKFDDLDNKDIW